MPLVFMTYYNPVLRFGLDAFCAACARAGVDGLIVPDLPPDEGADLDTAATKHALDLIYLLTPASTTDRVRFVAEASRGFVYLVSLLGVTGARASLPEDLEDFVSRRVSEVADGVIVGSRLVQLLRDDAPPYDRVRSFVGELRAALDA